MQKQYRVVEVERDSVLAQALDGAAAERLVIATPRKYVEHEVLIVELAAKEESTGSVRKARVISSRIDPSFLGFLPPKVEAQGEGDFEIKDTLSEQELDELEEALDLYRDRRFAAAGRRLRAFLRTHPLHIDCCHHLGAIEWDRNRMDRARKYFETGYRIGLLSIPEGFDGKLPWGWLGNRPFLRAAHGYGLALEKQKRVLEAAEVFEFILKVNPNDNQGIRHLLPEVYLNARAPAKTRAILEAHGPDGMNLYTMCLIEILDGRYREALRWLCRAVGHNPYVPDLVTSRETFATLEIGEYVAVGRPDEAVEYLRKLIPHWRKKEVQEFLRRLLVPGPFRSRLDRVLKANADLEGLQVGEKRSALVREMFSIFGEEAIPDILRECQGLL
jgi:tetratricopeptide (TPR) repeat protein